MKSDTVVLRPTLPGVGHNWMQFKQALLQTKKYKDLQILNSKI